MKQSIIGLTLLILLVACSPNPPQEAKQQIQTQIHKTEPVVYRICILQDISKSADVNSIPRIRSEHLKPIEDKLSSLNIELAFGIITDKLPPPFIRFKATALEIQDEEPTNSNNNVFKKLGEASARQRRNMAQEEQLLLYKSQVQADWKRFLDQISKASSQQVGATHIQEALERASIFFDEQPNDQDLYEYLIVISDGIDTSGNKVKLNFRPGIAILMVCSSQDIGIFQSYKKEIKLFESIEAAIQYAITN